VSIYSLQKKIAFIHIPKNAGTSIRANLKKAVPDFRDFDAIDEAHRKVRSQAFANHFPYWKIQELLRDTKSDIPFEDMKVFMVVRNPWERMLSLYRHRLRKLDWHYQGKDRNTELDKKVCRAGFVPWLLQTPHEGDSVLTRTAQITWGMNLDGGMGVDKILVMEKLFKLYADTLGPWGIGLPELGHSNVGDGVSKDYRQHYTKEARDHIEEYFAPDIEGFGYEF
jgi:hypothetical protein